MESKEYFEKVKQDFNQHRDVRSQRTNCDRISPQRYHNNLTSVMQESSNTYITFFYY